MDSKKRIDRVKRVARLHDFWAKTGHEDQVVSVVRCTKRVLKANHDERLITVVATTEDVDVDDEVVVSSGAEPDSYFFKNRSIFLDHYYDISAFVGKARRFTPRPNAKDQSSWEVQIRLHKDHPHTPMILDLAAEGGIGSSIGFARLDGGNPTQEEVQRYAKDGRRPVIITRTWEWIELSLTAMPANVHAQAIGFDEAKVQMLDTMLSKGTINREFAIVMGLDQSAKRLYPKEPTRRVVHIVDM